MTLARQPGIENTPNFQYDNERENNHEIHDSGFDGRTALYRGCFGSADARTASRWTDVHGRAGPGPQRGAYLRRNRSERPGRRQGTVSALRPDGAMPAVAGASHTDQKGGPGRATRALPCPGAEEISRPSQKRSVELVEIGDQHQAVQPVEDAPQRRAHEKRFHHRSRACPGRAYPLQDFRRPQRDRLGA